MSALEAFAVHGSHTLPGLQQAVAYSPLNWRYPARLGDAEAIGGRPEVSDRLYRRAIRLNPACGSCFVGLAENALATGDDGRTYLAEAARVGRSAADIRKRTGFAYARLGEDSMAAEEFRAALHGIHDDRYDFLDLLRRVYADDFIIDHVVDRGSLVSVFNYGRQHMPPDAMRRLWERLQNADLADDRIDHYAEYLLRHGLAREAWRIAFPTKRIAEVGIPNGGFESSADFSRFGWRIKNGEGVNAAVVSCDDCPDRGRALKLTFDGDHNVHYFGSTIYLPVQSGRVYLLSARVKGMQLTSARGPSIAVTGLRNERGCELLASTEEFAGSFDWREERLRVVVPAECDGIRVTVRRPRTNRLDKFVAGEFWADDFRLQRLAARE